MTGKFALIIGNSEYDDPGLARLKTPDADVVKLTDVLRSPDIGCFDEVATLINEPFVTVRRAIARFFADKQRNDLLLLYFSGHGVLDDRGQLYLAIKDTERTLPKGTAVEASFITDVMDSSNSRRQVLILDCCHSGAFARGVKGNIGASVHTASAFEGIGTGRVVLTATDATQYAWEGDQVIGQAGNSVFTHHLIQGLQTGEADLDVDGKVTLDELYEYVFEHVVHVTPKQTPGKWSYKQQGEIVIARNPNPRPVLPVIPVTSAVPDQPRPFWSVGRLVVIALLLLGLLGPWVRGCTPTAEPGQQPPPTPTISGLDALSVVLQTGASIFSQLSSLDRIVLLLLSVTLTGLIFITSLRLVMRLLRRRPALARTERFVAGAALMNMSAIWLLDFNFKELLWGFWVTSAGVILAVLNLIGESITARRRQRIKKQK